MNKAVFIKALDVESRLSSLGLSTSQLLTAVEYGEIHRNACTAFDPPCLPGILAWGKTMRGLREALVPRGWVTSDEQNFSIVLNSSGSIAIAVATGSEGTGKFSLIPKTKYPKGPATAAAVGNNWAQITLDFGEEHVKTSPKLTSDCLTWMLLIERNKNEINCELSLPKLLNDDGYVVGWEERILLPSIPLDGNPKFNTSGEEGADDIVVEISRRYT